ncbi:MAG: MlaD family protein [Flavobacteriales bacterium]
MKVSKEFIIGVVVVFTIAVLYMGVNYLKGVNLLSKQLRFYSVYENVAGLTASNAVTLNGHKIGIVSDVAMHPSGDGRLIVEVIINESKLNVPNDTKLEIFDADLFGGKGIRIVMGKSSVFAEDRDTLPGEIALGLTETIKQEIEPLKQKSSELFAGIDSVITSLNNVLGSASDDGGLNQVFSDLKSTLSNLESTTSSLDKLMMNNSEKLSSIFTNVESITSNLKANNDKLTNAITNISTLSDTLARMELATTVLKVNRALESFDGVMTKVNEGTGTLGQLVNNDSLHVELVNASHSLDLLLEDMRLHPKRYVHFSVFGKKEKPVSEN